MTIDPKKLTPEQREQLMAKIREGLAKRNAIAMTDIRRGDDIADSYIEFGLMVAESALALAGLKKEAAENIIEQKRAELTVLRDAFVAWFRERIGSDKSATNFEFAEFLRAFVREL